MSDSIGLRWLGVAGVELTVGDEVLAIDPYFTRFPLWRLWPGRVRPNAALTEAHLPHCDAVLVSHPHFDHLMDVPDVLRHTGALALGSDHTCRLLLASGIPPVRVRRITAGERLTLGRFDVEVLPAQHITLAGRPMVAGPLPEELRLPLRALDYRMDCCFSFLIRANGRRLLYWACERPGPAPEADLLFAGAFRGPEGYRPLLEQVRPQTVMPVHWDDFFRPLSQPLRPTLLPLQRRLPLLRRLDLDEMRRAIEQAAPGVTVLVPKMFREYEVV
ncbi:MAG TPA: MBL fold metallo-hydrolase [Anaerolineae bacterium]|nr:MBL fold metallo-hydrolase [Anaerolineae bacterium]HOQ98349.1 MBL fold metallo-hydrolase [Anaerolineae bacterium]HPL26582.1 MBL fold metallo-hydrolase [Anaerolineae bacterium]